jgi:hypothetical protein
MSEQIIDTLKDWFEQEWLYERHLTSELMKDKDAFQRGCVNFDSKQFALPDQLYLNLKKEAGLAEVAKENQSLLKYAFHSYRQIEVIYSLVFSDNTNTRNSTNLNEYLRSRIFNSLENNSNHKDLIEIETEFELIANKNNVQCMCYSNRNLVMEFASNEKITLLSEKEKSYFEKNPFGTLNFKSNQSNDKWTVKCSDVRIGNSQFKKDNLGYYKFKRMDINKQCYYFVSSFHFDSQKKYRLNWVQLNAFDSIKFYRDLHTHNIASFSKTPKFNNKLSREDQKYVNEPIRILNSDYYQRYVDNVISLYANYLENPHL